MAQKRIRSLKKSRAASVLEDAKQIIYKYGKQESLEKHIIKESQVKYCEGEETYSDEKKVFITVDLVKSSIEKPTQDNSKLNKEKKVIVSSSDADFNLTEKNNDSIDKNKENSSSKEAPPAFDSNTLPVIDLHNYKITHVNGIEAFKAVKSLDLSFNKIESVSGFEGLLHLRELKLYNNKISSLSGLARLSTLNNFEIHNNYINSISGLEQCRNIISLRLDSNLLTNLDGVQNLTQLKLLNVSHNHLHCIPHSISSLRNLIELDLSHNSIERIENIQGCVKLEELILDDNVISKCSVQSVKTLSRLDILSVNNNLLSSLDILFTWEGSRGQTKACEKSATDAPYDNKSRKQTRIVEKRPLLSNVPLSSNVPHQQNRKETQASNYVSSSGTSSNASNSNNIYITELYCSNNKLTSIRGLSSKLKNIEILHFDKNSIFNLQESVAELGMMKECLRELKMNMNPFMQLTNTECSLNESNHRKQLLTCLPHLYILDDEEIIRSTSRPDVDAPPPDRQQAQNYPEEKTALTESITYALSNTKLSEPTNNLGPRPSTPLKPEKGSMKNPLMYTKIDSTYTKLRSGGKKVIHGHDLEHLTVQFRDDVNRYASDFKGMISKIKENMRAYGNIEEALQYTKIELETEGCPLTEKLPPLPILGDPRTTIVESKTFVQDKVYNVTSSTHIIQRDKKSQSSTTSNGGKYMETKSQCSDSHSKQNCPETRVLSDDSRVSTRERSTDISAQLQHSLNLSRQAIAIYSEMFPEVVANGTQENSSSVVVDDDNNNNNNNNDRDTATNTDTP